VLPAVAMAHKVTPMGGSSMQEEEAEQGRGGWGQRTWAMDEPGHDAPPPAHASSLRQSRGVSSAQVAYEMAKQQVLATAPNHRAQMFAERYPKANFATMSRSPNRMHAQRGQQGLHQANASRWPNQAQAPPRGVRTQPQSHHHHHRRHSASL
jgi:hypothetical protein